MSYLGPLTFSCVSNMKSQVPFWVGRGEGLVVEGIASVLTVLERIKYFSKFKSLKKLSSLRSCNEAAILSPHAIYCTPDSEVGPSDSSNPARILGAFSNYSKHLKCNLFGLFSFSSFISTRLFKSKGIKSNRYMDICGYF